MLEIKITDYIKIKMSTKIIHSLLKFRQISKEPESGGIFVGKRLFNGVIMIIDFSKSQIDDEKSRYKFSKTSKIHQHFADDYFDKSEGFISLVGEWHTHPENIPTTSNIDLQSWDKIIADNDEKLFFIIIGLQAGRIYYKKSNIWISEMFFYEGI